MATYCIKCGTSLPDDAIFCLKCGNPLASAHPATQTEPQWEYCEVICKEAGGFWGNKSYFWGKAVGASGIYEVARSTIPF
jgi:zinc-ribbon domain